jgi:hypothetical protein
LTWLVADRAVWPARVPLAGFEELFRPTAPKFGDGNFAAQAVEDDADILLG